MRGIYCLTISSTPIFECSIFIYLLNSSLMPLHEVLKYFIKVFHISHWVHSWVFCFLSLLWMGVFLSLHFLIVIWTQESFFLHYFKSAIFSNSPKVGLWCCFLQLPLSSPQLWMSQRFSYKTCNVQNWGWNLPTMPKNLVFSHSQDSLL